MRTFYSFYADALSIALQSIFAHKLRAFLTLIGIIIGVASVVVVGASINGLNAYVLDKVGKILGANHFMISRMAHQGELSEEETERMNRRNKKLEWEDYEWVRDHCRSCENVGAEIDRQIDINHEGKKLYGTALLGVTANMVDIEDKTIASGRFISNDDVVRADSVIVIGTDIADRFFPGVDPVDRVIRIDDTPMRIVGVEERRGSAFGQSMDNMAYIPITSFRQMFGPRQSLQIHGKAASDDTFQAAIEDARVALRVHHKLKGNDEDDFGLVNVGDLHNEIDKFFGSIAVVVIPITVISLVVGGIVVMNIMLVSVTERTQEIGVRKAIGARRRDIVNQFLLEAMTLTFLGGALGVILSIGGSQIIMLLVPELPAAIPLWAVISGLGVSIAVGLIFGVWPARKASRLDPIECLRYE
ncbi:MAG TPA: ABC transporter permease [Pyrinomonadaceae bacterium]|nr:ABC transporter permease [Pyrinomonadaceae bacterium]